MSSTYVTRVSSNAASVRGEWPSGRRSECCNIVGPNTARPGARYSATKGDYGFCVCQSRRELEQEVAETKTTIYYCVLLASLWLITGYEENRVIPPTTSAVEKNIEERLGGLKQEEEGNRTDKFSGKKQSEESAEKKKKGSAGESRGETIQV